MKSKVRSVGEARGSKKITSLKDGIVLWKCIECGSLGQMSTRGWGMARTCCGEEYYKNRDRLLIVWTDMRARTTDPNHPAYNRYKSLGMSGWKDFKDFKRWAKATGYKYGLDLERVDNTKGYSPENCTFATRAENNRNRASNRLITAFEETKTLVEWSEDYRCSIQAQTIAARLDRYGWKSIERAIEAKVGEKE